MFHVYGELLANDIFNNRTSYRKSEKLVQRLGSVANSTNELMQDLELKHSPSFLYDYLELSLEQGFFVDYTFYTTTITSTCVS